jgi:hypothetical protein
MVMDITTIELKYSHDLDEIRVLSSRLNGFYEFGKEPINDQTIHFFKIVSDDKVLGFYEFGIISESEIQLGYLYIYPEFRGLGISYNLIINLYKNYKQIIFYKPSISLSKLLLKYYDSISSNYVPSTIIVSTYWSGKQNLDFSLVQNNILDMSKHYIKLNSETNEFIIDLPKNVNEMLVRTVIFNTYFQYDFEIKQNKLDSIETNKTILCIYECLKENHMGIIKQGLMAIRSEKKDNI